MCGRCSDYRGPISLSPRSSAAEIVDLEQGSGWQTALIVLGLMGIAVGAFLWSASPWYVAIEQVAATWLVNRDVYWPLAQNAPWFVLTHYPDVNDSLSWLDGAIVLLFIGGTALIVGGSAFVGLWLADRILPALNTPQANEVAQKGLRSPFAGIHKLAQGLIPAAGGGVFLGLSATTLTLLHNEGLRTGWANPVRFTLLALAIAWSLRFQWRLAGLRTVQTARRLAAVGAVGVGLLPFCWAWMLLFVLW